MREYDAENVHIGEMSPGTVALLKNIADEAAERTVRRFSTAMGIDPDDPMRAQRNMAFLDKARERWEGATGKVFLTVLGVAVLGAMHAAWAGFKSIVGAPGAH